MEPKEYKIEDMNIVNSTDGSTVYTLEHNKIKFTIIYYINLNKGTLFIDAPRSYPVSYTEIALTEAISTINYFIYARPNSSDTKSTVGIKAPEFIIQTKPLKTN